MSGEMSFVVRSCDCGVSEVDHVHLDQYSVISWELFKSAIADFSSKNKNFSIGCVEAKEADEITYVVEEWFQISGRGWVAIVEESTWGEISPGQDILLSNGPNEPGTYYRVAGVERWAINLPIGHPRKSKVGIVVREK